MTSPSSATTMATAGPTLLCSGPAVWQIRLSSMNYTTGMSVSWGKSGDIPLPQRP